MNILKARAFLLLLAICVSTSVGFASDRGEKDTTPAKKEIIVVSMDQELNHQLSALANYVYDLFLASNKGNIVIQTYMDGQKNQEDQIETLVANITALGVAKDNIQVENHELTLDQAYFSLSVSARNEIQ